MTPVFLDTSCVIALLSRADAFHEKASAQVAELERTRRPQVTTTGVLLELGDGFARKGRWQVIAPFLAATLTDPSLEIVPVDADLLSRANNLRSSRPDKDWGLTDCVSFVVMSDRGITEALT